MVFIQHSKSLLFLSQIVIFSAGQSFHQISVSIDALLLSLLSQVLFDDQSVQLVLLPFPLKDYIVLEHFPISIQ